MDTNILIAFVILIGLILLNFPIYIAIFASGVYLMVFVNHMPLQSVFTASFEGLTKNSLLAIPFFILAGCLISEGTLGRRLIDCFSTLLSGVRGGLPLACLLSNAVFGAISGSPPAATAVFARIIHKPIAEAESEDMATGLVVSAAGLSSIIPPSVTMIIYGVVTETDVGAMFIAGIIPGLIIVGIVGMYIVARSKARSGIKADRKLVFQAWWRGIPVLLLPILVLGGIYGGFVTPTEAGALSVAYCTVLGLAMREIRPRDYIGVLKKAMRTIGQVFLLIASSTFLARALTVSQFPQKVTMFFDGFSPVVFLLMMNVLLLIVGCFFDPSAAILVLAPMLLPSALALGINPIHLGIVFVVNLVIGMFTPPFGLNIFVAQSVLGYDVKYISKCLVPYICLYIVSLVLITTIPEISLWLPRMISG